MSVLDRLSQSAQARRLIALAFLAPGLAAGIYGLVEGGPFVVNVVLSGCFLAAMWLVSRGSAWGARIAIPVVSLVACVFMFAATPMDGMHGYRMTNWAFFQVAVGALYWVLAITAIKSACKPSSKKGRSDD